VLLIKIYTLVKRIFLFHWYELEVNTMPVSFAVS